MLTSVASSYRRARPVPAVNATTVATVLFALIFSIALVCAFSRPPLAVGAEFVIDGP